MRQYIGRELPHQMTSPMCTRKCREIFKSHLESQEHMLMLYHKNVGKFLNHTYKVDYRPRPSGPSGRLVSTYLTVVTIQLLLRLYRTVYPSESHLISGRAKFFALGRRFARRRIGVLVVPVLVQAPVLEYLSSTCTGSIPVLSAI